MNHHSNDLEAYTKADAAKETSSTAQQNTKLKEKEAKHCTNEASYYTAEADKIESELKSLGISFDDFEDETKTNIDALADVAVTLELREPTLTNYHLGLNHLEYEKLKLASTSRLLWQDEAYYAEMYKDIRDKCTIFERELAAVTEKKEMLAIEGDKRKTQTKFLSSKMKEYSSKAHDLEAKLLSSGSNPSLYHSKLVKDHEEICLLEEKLKNITSKLESYQNLPPNEELARFKVEEAKAELAHLQLTLQQKIEQKARATT